MQVEKRYTEFINSQMKELAAYDALRPEGHVYEFHLHSERVAELMRAFALHIGLDENLAHALYWATLPHDIGKMDLEVSLWDKPDKPTEAERALRRKHVVFGEQRVKRHFGSECDESPFLKLMLDIMMNHHETMDGKGFFGKTSARLSREVRMACICDAFDGWSIARPHFDENRDISPAGVVTRMEYDKKDQFDHNLLKQFKEMI